jgi:hypothetical protein
VNITVIRPDGTINDPANNIIGEWTVDTDENGAFETTYILDGIFGVYTVNAIDESGNTATTTFTDAPKVGSVTVGAQSPNPVAPGGSATYTITVNRGSGSGSSGSFTATLSITTSLPTGASASFSPNPVSFEQSDKSKTATLTITTSSSTPAGSYSFTVMAATSASDNATGVGTLNVQAVNQAPTLTLPSLPSSINEMVEWNFTATATDPDIPHQTLTFSLVDAPEGASINSSTGVFTWTPSSSQIGTYTFNVTVSDGSLTDYEEITVTVQKRPTTINYSGATSGQYSDNATLTATLTDLNGTALAGKIVTFTINGLSKTAVTNGIGVATVYTILDKAPGIYTVNASFPGDDCYLPSFNDENSFTIEKENARITYTGALFVSTASTTSGKAKVTLAVTVQDITAYDPASDPYPGDISKATVTFCDDGTSIATVPIALVRPDDTKTGTATYLWDVDIGNIDSEEYTISITVNGYYTASETVVVTVSKPLSTNFITGGGYIILSDSAGKYAGDAGTHANFGFNVKYNKGGKNLQGSVNVVFRLTLNGTLRTYQIKGNALTSLQVNVATGKATLFCKANLKDITDPFNPIPIEGNGILKLTMVDKGEPGRSDSIGITYWDNSGALWFSSNWNGTMTVEQLLKGGNLVVH